MIQTEQVTKKQVEAIRRVLGIGAILMNWDIDYAIGRGVLDGLDRCIWSKDGRRITINVGRGGTLVASQGSDPDPVYAELKEMPSD